MNQLPEIVVLEFDPKLFGEPSTYPEGVIYGKVLTIFRDSGGNQWVAFECEDTCGVHLIALGSPFFKALREEHE
jgi:hypothetical protein